MNKYYTVVDKRFTQRALYESVRDSSIESIENSVVKERLTHIPRLRLLVGESQRQVN